MTSEVIGVRKPGFDLHSAPPSLMCPWVGQGPPGPSGTNTMMKGSASVHL